MNHRGGVLDVVERVPIAWLPEAYREPMRLYLGQGVLPTGALRQLLEHDVGGAMPAALDAPTMLERLAVFRWIGEYLPASACGCRDQVQLWIVYVRRARGRALLATLGAG
jgi:hypothetical protein